MDGGETALVVVALGIGVIAVFAVWTYVQPALAGVLPTPTA